jgi:hypothetical protein
MAINEFEADRSDLGVEADAELLLGDAVLGELELWPPAIVEERLPAPEFLPPAMVEDPGHDRFRRPDPWPYP